LSAVGHDRSLELFCDRHEVIAHFASLFNDDPPPRRLLYLHGLGGNGKSLLLRFLAAAGAVPRSELGVALDLADALLPVLLMRAGKGLFDALDKRLDEVFTAAPRRCDPEPQR
jgi:hypothetical protein